MIVFGVSRNGIEHFSLETPVLQVCLIENSIAFCNWYTRDETQNALQAQCPSLYCMTIHKTVFTKVILSAIFRHAASKRSDRWTPSKPYQVTLYTLTLVVEISLN